MILSDPEHFEFKNHDFSARVQNCIVYLIQAVQKLQIHAFFFLKNRAQNVAKTHPTSTTNRPLLDGTAWKTVLRMLQTFSEKSRFWALFRPWTRDDSLNESFIFTISTDPDDVHFLMILSSSEHFWFKNHDFSARAPNCLVYVIVAVQNMKIHVFRKVPRIYRFLVNILRFL